MNSGDEKVASTTLGSPVASEYAPAQEGAASAKTQWQEAVLRELALRQINRLMSLEPKVLSEEDAKAIHDVRVATRRLQQIIDLIYKSPRSQEIRKLRRKIKRCRRVLGDIRNYDVLLQHTEKALRRKRGAGREAWEAVKEYLIERRAEIIPKALRRMSKINLSAVCVQLKHHLAQDSLSAQVAAPSRVVALPGEQESDLIHQRAAQSLIKLWNDFEAAVMNSHQTLHAPVIHRVRIAAKRLRYLTEVIDQFDVAGTVEVLKWLRGLQQELGDWHDVEVLEEVTIEMVARPGFLREHLDLAMKVGKLIQRNRSIKKKLEQKYIHMTGESSEYRHMKETVRHMLEFSSNASAGG